MKLQNELEDLKELFENTKIFSKSLSTCRYSAKT